MSRPARPAPELFYAAVVAAAFLAVALWRWDLVMQAARVSGAMFARGGAARWRLIGEVVLFCGILAATLKAVPVTPEPRRDALILAFGLLAGYAAEAWGTRAGLWSYYTGERPPLWIVPAWPLGALFIDRAARALRAAAPEVPSGAYWNLAVCSLWVVGVFCAPRGGWAWAGFGAAAVCLAAFPRPQEDLWLLAAGLACVLFADFWGTTNNCWRYWLRDQPYGLWRGIAFGMAFDSAVALGALKAARLCLSAWEAGPSPRAPRGSALRRP